MKMNKRDRERGRKKEEKRWRKSWRERLWKGVNNRVREMEVGTMGLEKRREVEQRRKKVTRCNFSFQVRSRDTNTS